MGKLEMNSEAQSYEDQIERELKEFEYEQRKELGVEDSTDQWKDSFAQTFTRDQRESTTILVSGLTMAHDEFITAALRAHNYQSAPLPCPNNESLRIGKEYGNRGQCNPTYFTVGNLIKFLKHLRDDEGWSKQEIIDRYIFLTGGACGPCRFGMYVTEYRKALRDAGFEGFRVILASQTDGVQQVVGKGMGLEITVPLFLSIMKSFLVADVLNLISYRLRPYEVEKGNVDQVVYDAKKKLISAIENKKSLLRASWQVRKMFSKIPLNKLRVAPKVAVIGEFWAMTTEGDGNYKLQKFLESEGAEVDIQPISAWLLYTIWELENDTKTRAHLKGTDDNDRLSLSGTAYRKKLLTLKVTKWSLNFFFQLFAKVMGLKGYHLPDIDEVTSIGNQFYHNELRGGEGNMEVAKLILNVVNNKVNMTISVKPFGCMPSSGVSDGVQSLITERYPEAIFLPIETSGDGAVNVYSRVQMQLFKAKQRANQEVNCELKKRGISLEDVHDYLVKNPQLNHALHRSPHHYGCTSADLVKEIAKDVAKDMW